MMSFSGDKDVEVTFETEVPCETMEETQKLNTWLKDRQKDLKPFELAITMPKYSDGTNTCKSLIKGEELMKIKLA
ncbi:MAG: hypothetical protein Q9M36_03000 [Sulfurovum sp.]|nr:hypothetical protein [Sulfurovum sp.]